MAHHDPGTAGPGAWGLITEGWYKPRAAPGLSADLAQVGDEMGASETSSKIDQAGWRPVKAVRAFR